MAGERVDPLVAGDVQLRSLVDILFAIGPLDRDAFLLEEALVVGDKLGKPLERCSCFQNEFLAHIWVSRIL